MTTNQGGPGLGRFHDAVLTLRQNLAWGALWGLCGAVVYSAFAVVVFLLAGQRAFSAKGTSLSAVLAAYLVGGIGSGLVMGALRPLGRSWWGAGVMGLVCAVPVWSAMMVAVAGLRHVPWKVVAGLTLLTGPVSGVITKRRMDSESR